MCYRKENFVALEKFGIKSGILPEEKTVLLSDPVESLFHRGV